MTGHDGNEIIVEQPECINELEISGIRAMRQYVTCEKWGIRGRWGTDECN